MTTKQKHLENPAPEQPLVSHTPDSHQKKRNRIQAKKYDTDSHSHSDDNSSKGSSPRRRKRRAQQQHKDVPQEEKDLYLAIDCEMVGVGYGGHRSALARVCIINWNGKKIFDTLVRPNEPVTAYRTFVSGITEEDLDSPKTMDFEKCRSKVQQILDGKIIVGHALKNDLHALNIYHPWWLMRDTGKYEPFMKVRFDDGVLWPRKLKELAKEKLGRRIQKDGESHSPFEDAKTSLDLYKLVRNKWEKAMAYKMNKTREIMELQQNNVEPQMPKRQ